MSKDNLKEYKLTIIIELGENIDEFREVCSSILGQKYIPLDSIQVIFSQRNKSEKQSELYDEYKKKFGDNLVYARSSSEVLSRILGEYVCFSNGYDLWDKKAVSRLCDYLDTHKDEIDVVRAKCQTINELTGRRIEQKAPDTIVDIDKQYDLVHFDLKDVIIKRKCLKFIPNFDGRITEETGLVLSESLIEKKKYGQVNSAVLWCREKTMRVSFCAQNGYYEQLKELSLAKWGEVIPYIQFQIMLSLAKDINENRNKDSVEFYLRDIRDEIIFQQTELSSVQKQYALKLKYGKDVLPGLSINDQGKVMFKDFCIFDLKSPERLRIRIIERKKETDEIVFEGYSDLGLLGNNVEVYVKGSKGSVYPVSLIPFSINDEYGYDNELIFRGTRFFVSLPLTEDQSIKFMMRSKEGREVPVGISLESFSRLNDEATNSYFIEKPYMISFRNNTISISRSSRSKHFSKELSYLWELLRKKKAGVVFYRIMYRLNKLFSSNKPIWIVADRPHVAKDNGEHLFKYLMSNKKNNKYNIYFLLKKDSVDYNRMSQIGKILNHDSFKHKMKFLQADKIIASAANNLATNAFGGNRKYYHDLYKFDFVYLRHGVSHNDQSSWLNRLNKNIRLLDTTSKREYEAVLEGKYLYDKDRVSLTGLPRYDNLIDESKNMITIMPTWRKNLEAKRLPRSSRREYIRDFVKTEYHQFYNNLINDPRLLDVMREYGYKGSFYVHPVFEQQAKDFIGNDFITVGCELADYQKVFKESNLMVTDYSSVAFDFAYLKKPVIYAQFDADSFYKNHSWGKGYFTYEKDGFGPIEYDYESTIETLIQYIKKGCKMERQYIEKVEDFFAYTDRNNCQRVYNAIESIN